MGSPPLRATHRSEGRVPLPLGVLFLFQQLPSTTAIRILVNHWCQKGQHPGPKLCLVGCVPFSCLIMRTSAGAQQNSGPSWNALQTVSL